MIVHNREASGDVQEILTAWIHLLASSRSGILERPGVLHSYSGTWDMAQWAVEGELSDWNHRTGHLPKRISVTTDCLGDSTRSNIN